MTHPKSPCGFSIVNCQWINSLINFKRQGFQDRADYEFSVCLFQSDNMTIRNYWACAKFFDDSPEEPLRFLDVLDPGLQDTGETAPDRQLAALRPALRIRRRLAIIRGSICRARSALMARGNRSLLCPLAFRRVPCKRKTPFWHFMTIISAVASRAQCTLHMLRPGTAICSVELLD